MIAMEVNGDVAAPALEVLEDSRKLRATKSFKIVENSPSRLGNFGPSVRRHPPHCNLQMLNSSASWGDGTGTNVQRRPGSRGSPRRSRKQRQPIFAEP
jgi:hypothetical protein